jgi:hypothetical protein
MAEPWTKTADWIPYFNALAQVVFWKDDLIKAQRSLDILEATGRYSSNSPEILLSEKEIRVSTSGLKVAQFKLKRSFQRITETDKINWADKSDFDAPPNS